MFYVQSSIELLCTINHYYYYSLSRRVKLFHGRVESENKMKTSQYHRLDWLELHGGSETDASHRHQWSKLI